LYLQSMAQVGCQYGAVDSAFNSALKMGALERNKELASGVAIV